MATHPSILAWEIPREEEPGGLQSTGVTEESNTIEATEWALLLTALFPNMTLGLQPKSFGGGTIQLIMVITILYLSIYLHF